MTASISLGAWFEAQRKQVSSLDDQALARELVVAEAKAPELDTLERTWLLELQAETKRRAS